MFLCSDGTRAFFARFQLSSPEVAASRYAELVAAGPGGTLAESQGVRSGRGVDRRAWLILRRDAVLEATGSRFMGESSTVEVWIEGDTIFGLFGPSVAHVRELEAANPSGCWSPPESSSVTPRGLL
jgi:hypothetical protein